MTEPAKPDFEFVPVVFCTNPMEIEIYPATLREKEIPHRTQWDAGGNLMVLVPKEWLPQAREALASAAKVFFGEEFPALDPATLMALQQQAGVGGNPPPAAVPPGSEKGEGEDGEDSEDVEEEEAPSQLFTSRQTIFSLDKRQPDPYGAQTRAVWPAWVLAALPGLGLGHLYAGKVRIFLQFATLTVVAVAFFLYSGSWYPLLVIVLPWGADLGFAARHVKEHNRRAEEYRMKAAQEEKKFLESV